MPRRRLLSLCLFAACVFVTGVRSVTLGKDVNWDLKNYHWYNAWALFNGRLGYDIAPAQLQTYHNPLADLPFYGLVHMFEDPRVVAFLMAVPVAIGVYFLLRILLLLFPLDRDRTQSAAWIVASAFIGLTGVAGTAAWGATFNEWPSIAMGMAALWLAVRAALEGESRRRYAFAVGGFLMGCAVGLKLTFAAYALGYLASSLVFGTIQDRSRRSVLTGIAMGFGFLATYGWWGWIRWREFANPVFPYFNSVFQSPWWEPIAFFDRNFGPRTWSQWLFFPFYIAREHQLSGEVGFRDYRLAVLFTLGVLALAVSRWRRRLDDPRSPLSPISTNGLAWRVLGVFTIVSYIAWLKVFGIYRYVAALEVISGALIVGCVLYIAPRGRIRPTAVLLLTVLIVSTTRFGWGWGRVDFGASYFSVDVPDVEANSLIILGYVHPLAYAAPFFDSETRFVSPANNLLQVDQQNLMAKRVDEVIRGHKGAFYFLQYGQPTPHDHQTLEHFRLVLDRTSCRTVKSDMDADGMRLCRLHARAR